MTDKHQRIAEIKEYADMCLHNGFRYHRAPHDILWLLEELNAVNSHGREGRNYTNADYEAVRARAQKAEEEIEFLRSQRDQIEKEAIAISRALRSQLESKNGLIETYQQAHKEIKEQRDQAEQERDKYQKSYHEHAAEVARLSEANTAMREALQWYAAQSNYDPTGPYELRTYADDDCGKRARTVLSRYQKEGDTACETDTAKI